MNPAEIRKQAYEECARIADLGREAAEACMAEELDLEIRERHKIRALVCQKIAHYIRKSKTNPNVEIKI